MAEVFTQVLHGQEEPLVWHVRGVSDYRFNQDLHYFMTKCPLTSTSTKVSLGKFYIAIDKKLQARGLCPDNAYHFIERIATYGLEDIQMNTVQLQVKECTEQITKLVTLVNGLKKANAETVKELQCTKHALRDVTNEVKVIKKQWAKAEKEA